MILFTKDKYPVELLRLQPADHLRLYQYLCGLSESTRNRFGPHDYALDAITHFYADEKNKGFIVKDVLNGRVIGYATICNGCPEHDQQRFLSYGIQIHPARDATLAPSVADEWQGSGLGQMLYRFLVTVVKENGIRRIFLWGGVQASNERALRFYRNQGFRELGAFMYNGNNFDMMAELE